MDKLHAGIREIKIENFRGIDCLHLSFVGPNDYPTQVVVLAGPNGCGKTAVLEACLLVTGHERLILGPSGGDAIRVGTDDYDIAATVQVKSEQTPLSCDSSGGVGSDLGQCRYFSSRRASSLVGSVGITVGQISFGPPPMEDERLQQIKQLLVNARAHELFPSGGSGEENTASRFSHKMDKLNDVWQRFYPSQTFSAEAVKDDPTAGFDVFVTSGKQGRLPVDSLSSGQMELFVFAGTLILDKLEEGIIFIDEPELHLDPQWHRLLLRMLALLKPRSQIVVATHSPEVYDSVRSFERHFLVPSDDPRADSWHSDRISQGVDE